MHLRYLLHTLNLSVLNYSEYKMNNFVTKTTAELTWAQFEDVWINVVEMYFWGQSVPICYVFICNFQIFKSSNGANLSCYINIGI